MAWIELHDTLPDHPKLMALAEYLNVDESAALGYLCAFWLWATKYAQDGKLATVAPRAIARGAKWHGDPAAFVESLFQAGWLDANDDGLSIHDWHDYAGRLIDMRAANRARMRSKRAAHVQRTCSAQPAHVQGLPNLTIPNLTNKEQTEHPFLLALRKATGNERIRWVSRDSSGFENKERIADTMAEIDSLVKDLGLDRTVKAFAAVPGVSVAERRVKAGDALAELRKTAPRADSGPQQYDPSKEDLSWIKTI